MASKGKVVQVRVTQAEFDRIKELAKENQLSVSVYCGLVLAGMIEATPRKGMKKW